MITSFASAPCEPIRQRADNRQFYAYVAHIAWRAGGGRSGDLPRELTAEIDRLVRERSCEPAFDVTQIPRAELRSFVEHVTASGVGALARLATTIAIDAAGGRATSAAHGMELGIALQMLQDLRATTDADAARVDLWMLRPTWAWVWTSESADAASWVRGVRWAQQVAARRSDPMPVARFLGQFANRHGAAEARARLEAVRAAIRATSPA